jgi:N-carbamoyl-L-amino-acid hydrolase
MMGSGVFAGQFDPDRVAATTDAEGRSFGAELERIGYRGTDRVSMDEVAAYFELHIEQGPVLEQTGKTIGVVTGAQGQRWFDLIVTGQEAHAGTTPMETRRDALLGAARIVEAVRRIGREHLPGACATVGQLDVHPNSRNTIPGRVGFSVDLRHPEEGRLSSMRSALEAEAAATCSAAGLHLSLAWRRSGTSLRCASMPAASMRYAGGPPRSGAVPWRSYPVPGTTPATSRSGCRPP